ncbi:MAG: hypothetical protein AAFR87_18360 [Bacteroidota bacterium]
MEDDILIEKYLKGLLSESEIEDFEKRLKVDAAFKQSVELEGQLSKMLSEDEWYYVKEEEADIDDYKSILASDEIQELEKTLVKVNKSYERKKSRAIKSIYYYIAAASVVLFLVVQLFFSKRDSHDTLYAKYSAIEDLPSFVSRSDEESQLSKAQILFENKEYEKALQLFEEGKGANNEGLILIYKGLAQIELEAYEAAEKSFDTLINSDLLDAEKGYWYKALLFIKRNKIRESRPVLEKIVSESLYNHPKAAELLRDLD